MLLKEVNGRIIDLSERDFKNEKELQHFFEQNIQTILGCEFVTTEFAVGDFRIDTLAFDRETKSFKIIEYKNVKNHSLVDQGYTYLKLLLERKADFVLKYNEITNQNLKISDIDFSSSRIIFVSPIFTPYQLNASDFKNIPIDLIKLTRYNDGLYLVDSIKKTSNAKIEEINILGSDNEEIAREIKVYTEEDHLNTSNENAKEIYYELRTKMLEFDNVDIDVKKVYIAFKGKTNIIDVECMKNNIRISINMKKGTLNGTTDLLRDVSGLGKWGNGDYRVDIYNKNELDYIIPFIKQSLEINKK